MKKLCVCGINNRISASFSLFSILLLKFLDSANTGVNGTVGWDFCHLISHHTKSLSLSDFV